MYIIISKHFLSKLQINWKQGDKNPANIATLFFKHVTWMIWIIVSESFIAIKNHRSLSLRNVAVFIVELSFQKESHTLLADWRNRDGSLIDILSTFIIKHLNSTRCWAGLIVSSLHFLCCVSSIHVSYFDHRSFWLRNVERFWFA